MGKLSSSPAQNSVSPIFRKSPKPTPEKPDPRTSQSTINNLSLALGSGGNLWLKLWFTGMLMGAGMTTGSAAIAFSHLISLPPDVDCKIAPLTIEQHVLTCGYQAMQVADMEAMLARLEQIGSWDNSSPLYHQAQKALEQWSVVVMARANAKARSNDLDQAIALLNYIPGSSPLYVTVQEQLAELNHQRLVMGPLIDFAQKAIEHRDWQQAQEYIDALRRLPVYDEEQTTLAQRQAHQVAMLSQRLRLEMSGLRTWQRVRQTQTSAPPHKIVMALEQGSSIDPSTYVWQSAQQTLEPLASQLLDYAEWRWEEGHWDEAIATARRVALIPALQEEARYLEQLCQAEKLAKAAMGSWTPSLQDSFGLMEAISALEQIPRESRFYAHTQRNLRHWQAHLQDLRYLHLAHGLASVGWSPTLAWAVKHAEQVALERPRRLQAQTLIAYWRSQLAMAEHHHQPTWSHYFH